MNYYYIPNNKYIDYGMQYKNIFEVLYESRK